MDERHRVLIADSYPDEAEQLKKEFSGKYNVISVRDNVLYTFDDIIPVMIYDGKLEINFADIKDRLI